MRFGIGMLALGVLAACGPQQMVPNSAPVALSEFGQRQAELVARHMLAQTYNDADALPVANCVRDVATNNQLFTLIDAPRDQARATFEALYAKKETRDCIEDNGVDWRPLV